MRIPREEFERFLDGLQFRDVVIPSTGEVCQMPLISRNNIAMTGFFSAERSKLLSLLPVPDLVPVELPDGRTLITVTAIEYAHRNIPPYNEVVIGIPAFIGKAIAPPTMEDLLKPNYGGAVIFMRHLIVDTRLAEILGNEILGYNKFISKIAFEHTPEARSCIISEAGDEMMRFTVHLVPDDGQFEYDRDTTTVASYKNGKLSTMSYPVAVKLAKKQPQKAELSFGPHPLGKILAGLDVSREALAVRYSTDWRLYSDETNMRVVKL